jgi:PD-(D/E)XK nuclease superfamily
VSMSQNPLIERWSYSAWSLFKKCPFAFKCAYIDKLRGPPIKAMERGTLIHKLAENYLNGTIIGGVPYQLEKLKREFKALRKAKPTCEKYWSMDITWKPKDYGWCTAKVDAYVPPTKQENVLVEVDHKTGGIYPEHVDQGSLYGAIGFGYYPRVDEIEVEFFYVDKGEVETYKYTRPMLRYNVRYWLDQGKELMSTKKFLPTPSKEACCKWSGCSFRSDKKLADGTPGPCKAWRAVR